MTDIFDVTTAADKANPVENALEEMEGRGPYTFAPVVDGDFLPSYPSDILARGSINIPLIFGVTKDDGGFFPALYYWDKMEELDANFSSIYCPKTVFSAKVNEVTKEQKLKCELVRQFYVGSYTNITTDTKQELIDLFGDSYFNFPTFQSVQAHARYAFEASRIS